MFKDEKMFGGTIKNQKNFCKPARMTLMTATLMVLFTSDGNYSMNS